MFPKPIQNLIDWFVRLPGVGPKTAERFVFSLLRQEPAMIQQFADALRDLQIKTARCEQCLQYSDRSPCPICADSKRDTTQLCLVADSQDISVLEQSNEFKGRYHVLGGLLSPVEGTTPDQLSLPQLKARLHGIKEIIIATDPTVEGEATALYIKQFLKNSGVKLTRLARGLPLGADLEYADPATLADALEGRREF